MLHYFLLTTTLFGRRGVCVCVVWAGARKEIQWQNLGEEETEERIRNQRG